MPAKILKKVYRSFKTLPPTKHPTIIVATDTERDVIRKALGHKARVIQTGAGMIHAFETIQHMPQDTPIINFGYVGSNQLKIGTIVCIKHAWLYHPSVTFDKPDTKYRLNLVPGVQTVDCYTSSDFVTQCDIKKPVVFDMELAAICVRFRNVTSVKVVSDCLDLRQYESTIKGGS